jgi:Bacterial regulatory protein, arsR family
MLTSGIEALPYVYISVFTAGVEMHSEKRNARKLTDEERLTWSRELKSRQTGLRGCAGAVGFCTLYAIQNPVRKKILRALEEKPLKVVQISELTGIEDYQLTLQIAILEDSHLIETEGDWVDLTPSGVTFVRTNNI